MKNKIASLALLLLVSACGGSGGSSSPSTPESSSPPPNQAPVISATNTSVIEGEQATLKASVSDSDGQISEYEWQQISGPEIVFEQPGSATLTFTAPEVSETQILTFELVVTDDDDAVSSAQINLTIYYNTPPEVTVEGLVASSESEHTLEAVASDAEGSVVGYIWEQTSGPSVSELAADGNLLRFMAPAVTEDTELGFRVTVTDNHGKQTPQDIAVLVQAPEFKDLELSGVLPMPLFANAEVIVSVGNEDTAFKADQHGRYFAKLSLEISKQAEVIQLVARPADAGHLAISAILGTVAQVEAQSIGQEDGSVRYDAQVDHISTAARALFDIQAQRMRGSGIAELSGEAELADISSHIPMSEIADTALMVKLILDNAESENLPFLDIEISDLQAHARDSLFIDEFLDEVRSDFASVYYTAESELFLSAQSDLAINSETLFLYNHKVVDSYSDPGASGSVGGRLTFDSEGAGYFSFKDGSFEFAWQQTDSGLQFTVPAEQSNNSASCTDIEQGGSASYGCTVYYSDLDVGLLTLPGGERALLITQINEEQILYGDGSKVQYRPTTYSLRFADANQLMAADQALDLEKEFVVNLPAFWKDSGSEEVPYDASFQSLRLKLSGSWQSGGSLQAFYPLVDENGRSAQQVISGQWTPALNGTLSLSMDESTLFSSANIAFIGDINHLAQANIELNTAEGKISNTGRLVMRSFDTSLVVADMVGIYQWPAADETPLDHFWFELNSDGTATTYSSWDANEDGVLSEDEIDIMPGYWRINDDNQVAIRRYRYIAGHAQATEFCNPQSFENQAGDSCILYHERLWNFMAVEEGDLQNEAGIYLSQQHKFFNMEAIFYGDQSYTGQDKIWQLLLLARGLKKVIERPVQLPD